MTTSLFGEVLPAAIRDPHLVQVVGEVANGRMTFGAIHRVPADTFVTALRAIATDCRGTR